MASHNVDVLCPAQLNSAMQTLPTPSMHKPELPCMLSTTYLTLRQDFSHKELCGCSSGREERWQHRLLFAMPIQSAFTLTAHLQSFHPPAWGFSTAGPTSCSLPLIWALFFPICCPICSSQKHHLPGREVQGSTVAPSPFAENWGWSASPVEVR